MGFYHEHLGLPSCNQSHGLLENSPFIDRWLHPHWHVHVLPGFLEGMMPMMNWRLGPCIRCIPFHCLVIFSVHSQDVCQNWCLGCIVPSLSAGLPPSQNASIRGRYPWEQQEGVCACFFFFADWISLHIFPLNEAIRGRLGQSFPKLLGGNPVFRLVSIRNISPNAYKKRIPAHYWDVKTWCVCWVCRVDDDDPNSRSTLYLGGWPPSLLNSS